MLIVGSPSYTAKSCGWLGCDGGGVMLTEVCQRWMVEAMGHARIDFLRRRPARQV